MLPSGGRWDRRLSECSATALLRELGEPPANVPLVDIGECESLPGPLAPSVRAPSARWEANREAFESTLREAAVVPEEAVTVAVSLDGVMVPMKDGKRAEKRERSRAAGRRAKGPAGYQEASCATLSFYDAEGDRLDTLSIARMPEPKKATLKTMLSAELDTVLGRRPDLQVVTVADGAHDNWRDSAYGFGWGDGGLGAAQLALPLVLRVTERASADAHDQAFKWEVMARLPQADLTLALSTVRDWVAFRSAS